MVLFTAARFSVKTGRTRSKGYQVWRSGRPEREAQPKEKMEEEHGGRLTRDRVTIMRRRKKGNLRKGRWIWWVSAWILVMRI